MTSPTLPAGGLPWLCAVALLVGLSGCMLRPSEPAVFRVDQSKDGYSCKAMLLYGGALSPREIEAFSECCKQAGARFVGAQETGAVLGTARVVAPLCAYGAP